MPITLGVIGCGKMAYAILKGLSEERFEALYVNDIKPEQVKLFNGEFQARYLEQKELVEKSDIVILAVKPQQVNEVMQNTRGFWSSEKLLVSIAAGIKILDIQAGNANKMAVIRVMPNTPCLVGSGVSAISGGSGVSIEQIKFVQNMFSKVGETVIIEEKYLDAVTAVSGSGPAYVFLVIEAMINAAVNVGLDASLARRLVTSTMKGSLLMLENGGEHPAVLKEQVCSPGGTTIAGIRQLEANGIRKAFFDAIDRAYQRSIELGK